MNGNHLSNTSKGYLKSTNGSLLKAMNGKELYSVLSLLKKEDSSFSSNLYGLLGVGKVIIFLLWIISPTNLDYWEEI